MHGLKSKQNVRGSLAVALIILQLPAGQLQGARSLWSFTPARFSKYRVFRVLENARSGGSRVVWLGICVRRRLFGARGSEA
jgi:hypothetical protein